MIKGVIFDFHGVLNRNLTKQTEVVEFAKKLGEDGYKIGVLSNMIRPITWFFRLRGDLKGYDSVVVSSDVGLSKPDPKIYQIILKLMQLKPEECIFIDDKPKNLLPPRAMGVQVVLAENSRQIINDINQIINT